MIFNLKKIAFATLLFGFQLVQAHTVPGDTLETCTTPEQIANAKTALRWVGAFEAWSEDGVKAQSEIFAEEFTLWHSSLATLAAIDINFSGSIVKRDADGYIQYEVPYNAPATKVFTFNSAGKIAMQSVGVDSNVSFKARSELNELLKKASQHPELYPPLPKDEGSKGTLKTYEEIFSRAFGS